MDYNTVLKQLEDKFDNIIVLSKNIKDNYDNILIIMNEIKTILNDSYDFSIELNYNIAPVSIKLDTFSDLFYKNDDFGKHEEQRLLNDVIASYSNFETKILYKR
jgi:hypothetical protein